MHANIQIVVGTYDKVLHGLVANVQSSSDVEFYDTFLFEAHTSAVRCLAFSPPPSSTAPDQQKIILASGGSDEKINLYHIATSPVAPQDKNASSIPSLARKTVSQNPRNRELGSLLHHASGINALYFPSRSKLLSTADDNTIGITRTRDWTLLSSIKSPVPNALGRPSGDTAPLGGSPAGVNDFAVHPSMKLMVSVGKGEKCMRLWNLVTGKKAGVLKFERSLLQGIGEGNWGSGEGRKVEWNTIGEEFVVIFERGAVLFGLDSRPKARIKLSPPTKLHQVRYVGSHIVADTMAELLAVSTEDGRIVFYSADSTYPDGLHDSADADAIPTLKPLAQIMGRSKSRIKDFEILRASGSQKSAETLYIVTASSNGIIQLFTLDTETLAAAQSTPTTVARKDQEEAKGSKAQMANAKVDDSGSSPVVQVGELVGSYETGHRITCLGAFMMLERLEAVPTNIGTSRNGKGVENCDDRSDSD